MKRAYFSYLGVIEKTILRSPIFSLVNCQLLKMPITKSLIGYLKWIFGEFQEIKIVSTLRNVNTNCILDFWHSRHDFLKEAVNSNICSLKSLDQNEVHICVSFMTFQLHNELLFLIKWCIEVPYEYKNSLQNFYYIINQGLLFIECPVTRPHKNREWTKMK